MYVKNNQFIAYNYLCTMFIIDFVAIVPNVLFPVWPPIIMLQFVRIFKVSEILHELDAFEQYYRYHFKYYKRRVWNAILIMKTMFWLTFTLHFLACFWVRVAYWE